MCRNRVPPNPSQSGKSRLLAEMTKPRHRRITLSILGLVWKMNQDGAEFCFWARLCKTHKCCLQHEPQQIRNQAGQGRLNPQRWTGWADPPKTDGLSRACQENSSSCLLFSAAIFPGMLLRLRYKVLIGGSCGQGTRSLFVTVWLASSAHTLLCKTVLLHQLVSSGPPS